MSAGKGDSDGTRTCTSSPATRSLPSGTARVTAHSEASARAISSERIAVPAMSGPVLSGADDEDGGPTHTPTAAVSPLAATSSAAKARSVSERGPGVPSMVNGPSGPTMSLVPNVSAFREPVPRASISRV